MELETILLRLVLASLSGCIIGYERGKHGRAVGVRTNILICVCGAMTSLISCYLVNRGYQTDIARIPAQVISGIGFLGAGIIIAKDGKTVTGLTTAAAMWTTSIIGIAFGYGFFLAGVVSTIICIFTTVVLGKIEFKQKSSIMVYAEINDPKEIHTVQEKLAAMFTKGDIGLEVVQTKSGKAGNIGVYYKVPAIRDKKEFLEKVKEIKEIDFIVIE